MTLIPLSRGHCLLCRDRFRKAQMVEHVAACPRWETGPRRRALLLVEGTPAARHWFFLAADITATLHDLDRFLRESILEALPGESSAVFRGLHRRRVFRARPNELDPGAETMDVRLDTVLEPGVRLWYDAAPDVSLAVRALVERKGTAAGEGVQLVARSE